MDRELADKSLAAEARTRLTKEQFELGDKLARRLKRIIELSIPSKMPGEIGEDAAQKKTMAGIHANAHAKNLAAMEEVGRQAVLDVLTPQQVANWVVAAPWRR